MFITGGDGGHCENTIHMVLARPEGGAPGSPGIGLYIVPKIWVNADGTLGKPNDVRTARLEHKMGLHAQATALLNFGDDDECYGIRLGPPPDERGHSQGLAMMFHMMNESRIGTGHNANTQAAAAYYFASQFATERIQGRPFGIKNAERVPIIKHEDVRRMLLDMKAHVEGIRAMVFKAFYYLDIQANSSDREKARKMRRVGRDTHPDGEMLRQRGLPRNDFPGNPDPRRGRLYPGISGRTISQGFKNPVDLGRNFFHSRKRPGGEKDADEGRLFFCELDGNHKGIHRR